MLKELTSRGILFICLSKGRSCTYLDAKIDIELKKFKFNKPGEIQVHQSSQSKQTSASKISHDWICITCEVCLGFILYTLGYLNGIMRLMNSNWTFVRHL